VSSKVEEYLLYLEERDRLLEQYRACREYCNKLPGDKQLDCFKRCESKVVDQMEKLKTNIVVFGRDYHAEVGA